ncbi:hypothetical protein BGX27_004183 [Mortierella sp. AM989]|nr:hypothetical protein BGX27_004183 [Mortierella sp. AM989]
MSGVRKTKDSTAGPRIQQEPIPPVSPQASRHNPTGIYTTQQNQENEHGAVEETKQFQIAAVILFICIIAFVLQTELTKFVQTSMGYQKPYFILYISHSFWAIALPAQFLYTAYISPAPSSLSTLQERINYFSQVIRQSTADLYYKKTDYDFVGADAETNVVSPLSPTSTSPSFATVYTPRENITLSRYLFWITLGITALFMVPSYLWYTCVAMTSMANLTAIYNTACFFAYLFSVILLKEKIVPNKVLAVFLSLFGVAIISLTVGDSTAPEGSGVKGSSRATVSIVGDVLALIGAALYGFEEVVYKKYASSKVQPVVFANTLTGLMGVVTFTMFWVPIPLLHWMGHEVFELPTLNELSSILMIATLGLIYNGCFMIVVSQTSPVFAAVGIMATIPLVALTDWVLFNEAVGWGNVVGGLSILLGFSILTLAPKLNGDKIPSKQGTLGNTDNDNNGSSAGVIEGTINTHTDSSRSNVHRGPLNASGSLSRQGPTISRQTNPFAKGFSGLRTDGSLHSRLSANQPAKIHEPVLPHRIQSSENPPNIIQNKGSIGSASLIDLQTKSKPTTNSSALTSEADISFGADDFLMGSDELALVDLMDEDDNKDNENELTLSWPITPPKVLNVTTQSTVPSQSSQNSAPSLSHFNSTSAAISAASKLRTPPKQYSAAQFKSTPHVPVGYLPHRPSVNTARTPRLSPPSSSPLSSSYNSVSSRIIVVNSQETPSGRPNVQDTVDQRSALRDQKHTVIAMQGQERQGFLRSQSSPSAGTDLASNPARNRRKLPGPAGNLPRLSAEEKEQLFRSRGVPFGKDTRLPTTGSSSPNSSIKKKMKAVHQGPIDSMFATGAWEDMIKAYKLPDYKPSTLLRVKGAAPMIELSISDIENRPELHRSKISGLVVMIKEVSLSEIDAAVTLLDPSGEMRGTMHRTVLDQYKNNEIRVGTVLALKNVSVFSPTPVSHYLIITLRNILGIFLPRPSTIILSQGSSQDRLSQKKRKLTQEDNQDSLSIRHGGRGSQTSSTSDTPVISSGHGGQPSLSPDWNDVRHFGATAANKSSASLEMLNMTLIDGRVMEDEHKKAKSAPPSQNTDRSSSPSGAQHLQVLQQRQQTQIQEIQFQSLRPTIGGMSAVAAQGIIELGDVAPTPIITLGAMTPDISAANAPERSSKSILSSFAASPNLRKRSTSSVLSQRSNSSITSPPPSRGSLTSQPSSSPIPLITQRSHSFSDWPDELGEDDFAGALGSDTSHGSIDIRSPKQSTRRNNAGTSSSATLLSPISASPQRVNRANDDDDDLDTLLDGLDENELLDL